MQLNDNWNCPMSEVMNLIGGKWRVNIIWVIHKYGTIRFNHLQKEVTGITSIMLTRSLETMIEAGLVERRDYEELPLRVEYSLTNKGQSLMPILKSLNHWGRRELDW